MEKTPDAPLGSSEKGDEAVAIPPSVIYARRMRTTDLDDIRVFLVDDHPLVRDGLRFMLERKDGFSMSGEAGSGEETLEQLPKVGADLAIVDISMEGMDGIELTRRLKERAAEQTTDHSSPEPGGRAPEVLIASMYGETHYVEQAFAAGARGYVLKYNVHALLSDATREVLDGGMHVDPDLEHDRSF